MVVHEDGDFGFDLCDCEGDLGAFVGFLGDEDGDCCGWAGCDVGLDDLLADGAVLQAYGYDEDFSGAVEEA